MAGKLSICISFFIFSSLLMAENLTKVQFNEDDYVLLNVKLKNKILLEGIEGYQVDNQILLPAYSILKALELKRLSTIPL